MSSIAIVFRKDKLNKKNEAPIHFRIIKNRKPRYITAGVMLHEKYWDSKNGKVKSSFKNSARLNNFLTTQLAEYQNKLLESETHDSSKSTADLRDYITKNRSHDFFEFAYSFIKQYLSKGQVGTHDKCKSILDKLKDYAAPAMLTFGDISPSFLTEYEKYLMNTRKNMVNTINGNMRFISRLFNAAYHRGLIEHKDIPFLKYIKPKVVKTHKEFLTEQELTSFEKTKVSENTKLAIHKDIFVFSCYGGGARISDLLTFKWKDFDGKHLNFSTNKTDTQLSILLPDISKEILGKYTRKKKKLQSFIFPVLPDNLDMKNPKEVDKAITSATTLMNKNLKILAKRANIEKNISTHTARHTWATRALRKGISIDKVSKILGHTNIKQTQVYAKIVDSELDKAMLAFN